MSDEMLLDICARYNLTTFDLARMLTLTVNHKNRMEFADWWGETGSGMTPGDQDDLYEHTLRVAAAAWRKCAEGR